MRFEDLYLGLSYSMTKSFSSEEVEQFARISGDNNMLHVNKEYAENSMFHGCIVHGFLTGSLFSAIIGTKMPGPGSVYLGQNMNFKRPVYHGQKVTATVTVTEIRKDKPIVRLSTVCVNESGETVIDGEAIVKVI